MTGNTTKKAEVRKNWVAPELKKVGIEEITATGPSHTGDYDGSLSHS